MTGATASYEVCLSDVRLVEATGAD